MQEQRKKVNTFLIQLVKECPLIYDCNDRNHGNDDKKLECYTEFALLINNKFKESMTPEDVRHRWTNIKKSFTRAVKNGKKFYLESEIKFLVKHLKYFISPNRNSEESLETEEHSNEDDDLTLGDVLRCKVRKNEKTSIISNETTSEKTNSFALALKKLRSTSTIDSYLKNETMESSTKLKNDSMRLMPSSSTTSEQKRAIQNEVTVPKLDKFAVAKRAKATFLEGRVEILIDKSMQFINDTTAFHQDANNDNEYEQSIREMLRSVPYDKIPDFVTNIHIVISSFRNDQ